jgi:Spy/CpxP family protein refolding chaperone
MRDQCKELANTVSLLLGAQVEGRLTIDEFINIIEALSLTDAQFDQVQEMLSQYSARSRKEGSAIARAELATANSLIVSAIIR